MDSFLQPVLELKTAEVSAPVKTTPPAELPILPHVNVTLPNSPESTAKFQSATDLRDVVLEDVLLLKSVIVQELDLPDNIAPSQFAPTLANTVDVASPLTPVTALTPDIPDLYVMSQSVMLLSDAALEIV